MAEELIARWCKQSSQTGELASARSELLLGAINRTPLQIIPAACLIGVASQMIQGSAVYRVVEAMAPLYTAAALGYASVRWLGAFSGDHCTGINRFVALYAIPALIFRTVATSDPYAMNIRFVAADSLQKAAVLISFTVLELLMSRRRRRRGRHGGDDADVASDGTSPMKWAVSNFSSATMTSNVIMGVPLLKGMYGEVAGALVEQLVVTQVCVWYNVVLFLYECIAALDGARISPGPPDVAENVEVAPSNDPRESEVAEARGVSTDRAAALTVDVSANEATQSVMMRVIWTAGKKLVRIPNTYASFIGLAWSLIAFMFGIKMPKIVDDSVSTISTTAVGLSMFSSGAFIARQQRFVPCGYGMASLSMVLKFVVGPVVMLLASVAIGLRGTILRIAVAQAALPLAISSFVYAEEYQVHADIMSTGVILGTFIISLPVTITYFLLLGL